MAKVGFQTEDMLAEIYHYAQRNELCKSSAHGFGIPSGEEIFGGITREL